MKLVNIKVGEEIHLGIKMNKGIIDISLLSNKHGYDLPCTMEEVIKNKKQAVAEIEEMLKKEQQQIKEDDIIYAPSIINPGKILCIGLNYKNHSEEFHVEVPKVPVIFSKSNNTLAAHKQTIPLSKHAKQFDYEAELVIVMGRQASNVSREDALSYVFGYTVGNDLTARDIQFITGQWFLGKSLDLFGPIGPSIITSDEINPDNLEIKSEINGEVRQLANTGNMIFDCADIISYISTYITLNPGDIIFTGTPGGVILGYEKEKQIWLKAGDEIKVTIEKIGTLINVLN